MLFQSTDHLLKQICAQMSGSFFVKELAGEYIFHNDFYAKGLASNGYIKKNSEILGKTDSYLFGDSATTTIRKNDTLVAQHKKPMEFIETVTSQLKGKQIFYNQKQPLFDQNQNIIAVMGHAVEVTNIPTSHGPVTLTERELQCLSGRFFGQTTQEIGERLFLSKRTVESHIETLRQKLFARNRQELLSLIFEAKLEALMQFYRP